MSTYVREKVLRIPRYKMNFAHIVRRLEEKRNRRREEKSRSGGAGDHGINRYNGYLILKCILRFYRVLCAFIKVVITYAMYDFNSYL